MKFKFSFLVALSATLVAGCAAYYSVFGLSQLFAGASLAVIIMASSLEFSKIVAVSFLHKYWKKITLSLKIYLTVGVVVLVAITSAGIYGFLSNAYQKTASKLEVVDGQINVLTNKKTLFDKSITDNQNIITVKTNRLNQLNGLRISQENRLDLAKSNSNANNARKDINAASNEIQKINLEIDNLSAKNATLLDSSNAYANKIIEVKSGSDSVSEVGPLKYLAQLTGYPMDKIVNLFILLLIFVFDPLAVALVLATNKVLEIERENENNKLEEPIVGETITHTVIEPQIEPITEPIQPQSIETITQVPTDATTEPILEDEVVESEIPAEELAIEETVEPVVELPVEQIEEPAKTKTKKESTARKIELNDIKEIKESTNRGFSKNIPVTPKNSVQRIGSNKLIKDGNNDKVFFKRKP